jgi:hypothetical protein
MNTADVMRMIHRLKQPEPSAPVSAPTRAPVARAPRRVARAPSPSSSEYSYSESSSSSESEYEELDTIKKKFAKDPCEYISPAALRDTKTKDEAVAYLKAKQCPKLNSVRRVRMSEPAAPPMSESPAVKKAVRVKKAPAPVPAPAPAPVPAPEAAPVPAPKKVRAPKAVATPAPAPAPAAAPAATEAAAKKKRAASAYNLAVGKHRKAGLSFTDAAKAAKAEVDAAKAKAK